MNNSEKMQGILKLMEEKHMNLYHDVKKEDIEKHIAEIKNLNDLTEDEFDYEMLKLFALFKDGHTNYFVPYQPTNLRMVFIKGKLYVPVNDTYEEVKSVCGLSVKQFCDKIKEVVSYETESWLNKKINTYAHNFYYYKIFKLVDKNGNIKITTIGGKDVYLSEVEENQSWDTFKPYRFEVIGKNILYVKYLKCIEHPNYLFKDFMKDVKKVVESKNIKNYILDVRDNDGGNSEILNPFQDFVRDKKLNGAVLMNNGTFSSGRFAVARFKRDFNVPLIGEMTGGAAKSYGQTERLQFEDKKFGVSVRLWDFSNIFGYTGDIKPDIYVPTTIEDIINKKDPQLEKAIEIVAQQTINAERQNARSV